ncbi:MAG TPA: oligosaccharide flippase family protein [Magnetospirillum sp.]|nr:oligosaccharide flippase family protein [Magnetospirillum sp.]
MNVVHSKACADPRAAPKQGNPLRKFLGDGALYMAVVILQKACSFFTVPILTHVFAPDDYGLILLLTNASGLLAVVLGLGLEMAMVIYLAEATDPRQIRLIASTTLWIRLVLFGCSLAAILAFLAPVATILVPGRNDVLSTVAMAAVSMFCMAMLQHFGQILQAQARNRARAFIELMVTIIWVVTIMLGVLVFHWGPTAIYVPGLIMGLVLIPIYLVLTRDSFGFCFSLPVARRLLQVGLPQMPANVAAVTMTSSASFFVQAGVSLAAVGVLNAAASLANMVSLFFFPFAQIWLPFVHRHQDSPMARADFVKIHTLYLWGLALVLAGVGLFAQEATMIVLAPEYRQAFLYVPPLIAAAMAFEIGNVFAIGLGIAKKTYHRAWVMALCAALYLGSMWLLLPRLGLWAVPLCALAAYTVGGVLLTRLSNRYYAVPYAWGRALAFAGVTLAVVLGLYRLEVSVPAFLIKTGAFAALAAVALWLNRDSLKWKGFSRRAPDRA